jgi:hypothetical protein
MKRARTGTPEPEPAEPAVTLTYAPLSHITGAAAVHMLFMRVALATTAREVLGMPDTDPTAEDVWRSFGSSWSVLYPNEGNIAWILEHKLDDYAYEAEQRLMSALDAMLAAAGEM